MDYGLQMFSVRDITEHSMEKALYEAARMGYKFVEFAGFFNYSAKEIKNMLDRNGLDVLGTHTRAAEFSNENIDKMLAYHYDIGNKNIVIPGADLSTREKVDAFIEMINERQPVLEKAGITLHYHNHWYEFEPNADGVIAHTELEKRTGLLFEIDTYWVFEAGLDSVQTMRRLKDRIRYIHLKDGDGHRNYITLGQGKAPVPDILKCATELGFKIFVECELGLEEAERCMGYLTERGERNAFC